jgi:hypothetical protein
MLLRCRLQCNHMLPRCCLHIRCVFKSLQQKTTTILVKSPKKKNKNKKQRKSKRAKK